jgi:uncharacterized membrane-anchored protein
MKPRKKKKWFIILIVFVLLILVGLFTVPKLLNPDEYTLLEEKFA